MRTLGIDLASQPRLTATCAIDWADDRALVLPPKVGRTDDDLVGEIEAADVSGIDAPFGFPQPFAAAVASWCSGEGWPPTSTHDLRFRRTDLTTREMTNRWPLSVSSDLIALPAWRCARLLTRLGIRARDGSESIIEVYPGAALTVWGFERAGYKSSADARALLVGAIAERVEPWLRIGDEVHTACCATDHALDALVAALVARAAAIGQTVTPGFASR